MEESERLTLKYEKRVMGSLKLGNILIFVYPIHRPTVAPEMESEPNGLPWSMLPFQPIVLFPE